MGAIVLGNQYNNKMPCFTVDTNVAAGKIPENFNEEVTAMLEENLGKPKKVRIVKYPRIYATFTSVVCA